VIGGGCVAPGFFMWVESRRIVKGDAMTKLNVRLLGPLRAEVSGESIQDLKTNKVRGLLAYLAVESNRLTRREMLAGMFWPEFSERRARANLSQALFTLRHAIGDDSAAQPFLVVTRDTIQFDSNNRLWVDAHKFTDVVSANKRASTRPMVRELEAAVALYMGEFLEGVSVDGSPSFETWCLTQREIYHRLMSSALSQLVDFYEREAEYETALTYASHLVILDAWREEAHVALMRQLALCGRRSEALIQYETCRRVLEENLNIAPMRQTTALFEAIRDERPIAGVLLDSSITEQIAGSPTFLVATRESPAAIICVARKKELTRLEQILEDTLSGQGRAAFIAGEAGSGKTVLCQSFARQALARHPQLLVVYGKGTAYTGFGDPYATFRDIASQLTGNVATQWMAGTMTREQALRLWRTIPLAVEALVRDAPGLVGTFLDGAALLERAKEFAQEARFNDRQKHWLSQLETLVASAASGSGSAGQHQNALFEQFLRFLTTMNRYSPLLLVLDDLQWADAGTISLLFHINRNLAGQRMLLLGAFRPEEIAFTQDGHRHPLQPIVHETRREFGDVLLELGQKPDPSFVEALIDNEPNNLDEIFRARLFKLTGGHALYTAELLRGLQERGDLRKGDDGRWEIGPELDWDTLPPRVEGVIAERIARLPRKSQRLLQAACVQGETFVAEVVAQALDDDEAKVIFTLGNELSRDHHLVHAKQFERAYDGRGRLSTYQFHHFLFQKYLYDYLDPIDKAHLHEVTGEALALRCGEVASELSVQLARHFEAAGILDRAVHYRLQAGNYAVKLAANDEAIRHFARGLALLDEIIETPESTQQELELQLGLGTAHQLKDGYGSSEAERAYDRALDLCNRIGESSQLIAALWPLATYATMIGDLSQGLALAEQGVAVAQHIGDPLFIAVAHHHLGWILYHHGRFAESVANQEITIKLYDRQYHEPMIQMFGHDFGVTSLGWIAWPLCFLGFPDKALQRCHEAIALAQEFDHPFSLVHAFSMTAQVHSIRGEWAKSSDFGERMWGLATEYGFSSYIAAAYFFLGEGLVAKGRLDQGLAYWRKMLHFMEMGGVKLYHRGTLATVARLLVQMGCIKEAQDALAEADAIGYRDHLDTLLEIVRGQLMAAQGQAPEEVEACFLLGVNMAQEQGSKWFELQATMNLCQLWQKMGRRDEARDKLTAVCAWFTEGFDTPIMQTAAALLQKLT
jgi:DNA-binding SARP family transcriptional activator